MGCLHSKCCTPSPLSPTTTTTTPSAVAGAASAPVPTAGLALHHASLTHKGFYPDDPIRSNQDRLLVLSALQRNPNAHLFAVFDGHGQFGADCAHFALRRLPQALADDPRLLSDPSASLASAFLAVNRELRDSEIDDSMSGTTAVAVLVLGDAAVVANAGDSRAVAGVWDGERGAVVAEDLSWDQTPFRGDELERVKGCGARVLSVDQVQGVKDPELQRWESDDGDPPRVWVRDGMYPGTAFTRSLGDSMAERIGVIAEPEIKTVKITENHLFFVVASDGVFEFLSSQDVVDMVSRFDDPREACSAVAAESYRLWLEHENRTDDITIIIVHIKDLCEDDGAADEVSKANNCDIATEKLKVEKCVHPESELYHLKSHGHT